MDAEHKAKDNELTTPDFARLGVAPEPCSLAVPVLTRYICTGDADIRQPGEGRSERGRITNLSCSGCCVKSGFPFKPGDQVEMILQINKISFRVAGKVVHVPSLNVASTGKASASGMGVAFQKMSAGARSYLQGLVAELNTGRALTARHAPNSYPLLRGKGSSSR